MHLFCFSDEEFERYLPSEYYFKHGLYMFDIGQNDLAGAFYNKNLDQVLALIPTILNIFQDGIKVSSYKSHKI